MKKGCTTTVCKEASNEISTICNHNVWEWAMNALHKVLCIKAVR